MLRSGNINKLALDRVFHYLLDDNRCHASNLLIRYGFRTFRTVSHPSHNIFKKLQTQYH